MYNFCSVRTQKLHRCTFMNPKQMLFSKYWDLPPAGIKFVQLSPGNWQILLNPTNPHTVFFFFFYVIDKTERQRQEGTVDNKGQRAHYVVNRESQPLICKVITATALQSVSTFWDLNPHTSKPTKHCKPLTNWYGTLIWRHVILVGTAEIRCMIQAMLQQGPLNHYSVVIVQARDLIKLKSCTHHPWPCLGLLSVFFIVEIRHTCICWSPCQNEKSALTYFSPGAPGLNGTCASACTRKLQYSIYAYPLHKYICFPLWYGI